MSLSQVPRGDGRAWSMSGRQKHTKNHCGPGPETHPLRKGPARARLTLSRGRESNPQETDLQSVALTILPPRRSRGQETTA
jgi:hypothetical protein